jgi:uncharacterized membrane protein YgcG
MIIHLLTRTLPATLIAFLALAVVAIAAAPPFPEPVEGQRVYDQPDVLSPAVEATLESQIAAIEERTGAQIVIYIQVDPSATGESNKAAAAALIDQWGIGRAGEDDGFVILISYQDDLLHGQLSTYAGSGFDAAYLSSSEQDMLREDVMAPYLRTGDPEGALLAAMEVLEAEVTTDAAANLVFARFVNAALGLIGAPLILLLTVGVAAWTWRRYGADPRLSDSESVLMAGPPAGMTPTLATVVRNGRANQHSIQTLLVDLAGSGRLRFENLGSVRLVRSDDEPDPLIDPRIELLPPPPEARPLGPVEEQALADVSSDAFDGILTRQRLWGLNQTLEPTVRRLDAEAVRLGWLARLPGPAIRKWRFIGSLEVLLGAGALVLGNVVPMSGLTLVGIALIGGGVVTVVLSRAMSQRTREGAYVDAMLTAYRRTLAKTLALSHSMEEVVAEPIVATLADTPDRAVVWGIALGLHDEISALLARSLEDATATTAATAATTPYFPTWLGSNSGPASNESSAGSLFSSGGIPDVGGMFNALTNVGSTPPAHSSSSGSSGGSFGGGSSSGGSGGSTGF